MNSLCFSVLSKGSRQGFLLFFVFCFMCHSMDRASCSVEKEAYQASFTGSRLLVYREPFPALWVSIRFCRSSTVKPV